VSDTTSTDTADVKADSATDAVDTSTDTTTDATKTTDPDLGDAGKKALKSERDARKAAEKTAQESATKLTELEAEVKRLQRSNAAAKGTDLDAVKAEIRAEFAGQLAETAIKAEAKGRLTDPTDALLYIKAADIDTSDDDAVKTAIDQLLKDKPYLAAESGPKPWGDVGGGQRETAKPEPATPMDRMRNAYDRAK
jgi:hypothetical protein